MPFLQVSDISFLTRKFSFYLTRFVRWRSFVSYREKMYQPNGISLYKLQEKPGTTDDRNFLECFYLSFPSVACLHQNYNCKILFKISRRNFFKVKWKNISHNPSTAFKELCFCWTGLLLRQVSKISFLTKEIYFSLTQFLR